MGLNGVADNILDLDANELKDHLDQFFSDSSFDEFKLRLEEFVYDSDFIDYSILCLTVYGKLYGTESNFPYLFNINAINGIRHVSRDLLSGNVYNLFVDGVLGVVNYFTLVPPLAALSSASRFHQFQETLWRLFSYSGNLSPRCYAEMTIGCAKILLSKLTNKFSGSADNLSSDPSLINTPPTLVFSQLTALPSATSTQDETLNRQEMGNTNPHRGPHL